MAEGDTVGEKDWAVDEPMPMLALSVWEAVAQEHASNPSAGLWEASRKTASATGVRCNVGVRASYVDIVRGGGWCCTELLIFVC